MFFEILFGVSTNQGAWLECYDNYEFSVGASVRHVAAYIKEMVVACRRVRTTSLTRFTACTCVLCMYYTSCWIHACVRAVPPRVLHAPIFQWMLSSPSFLSFTLIVSFTHILPALSVDLFDYYIRHRFATDRRSVSINSLTYASIPYRWSKVQLFIESRQLLFLYTNGIF